MVQVASCPLVSSVSPRHHAGKELVGTPSSAAEVASWTALHASSASGGCSEEGDHQEALLVVRCVISLLLSLISIFVPYFSSDFLG